MNSAHRRLLVDTNLLVLFTVGKVNRDRIPSFKRTSKYTAQDYDLLIHFMGRFKELFTVAHVMAEVSNLTRLEHSERLRARMIVKDTIAELQEPVVPSARAANDPAYKGLGLADAAIAVVAREHQCDVLTDDFDLYWYLSREGLPVWNFAHLQVSNWRL